MGAVIVKFLGTLNTAVSKMAVSKMRTAVSKMRTAVSKMGAVIVNNI